MIDLVKNEDDMDTIIEAYYNFKGHNTIFSNLMIDNLVRASVSVKKPQKVFDIFAYHHYLLYYPHTKTINLLLVNIELILFKATVGLLYYKQPIGIIEQIP